MNVWENVLACSKEAVDVERNFVSPVILFQFQKVGQ
jgi:hypothetical protein